MNFANYKTESLERIAHDPRFAQHHAEIDALLRQRQGHLSLKRGIEVLTEVARSGQTTHYKSFFEATVGGNVTWNHTQMGKVAKFLGLIQRHCAELGLPVLPSLVVNMATGECGAGFFKDLNSLSPDLTRLGSKAAAQQARQACWTWAAQHPTAEN
jgi:hypothetical protein